MTKTISQTINLPDQTITLETGRFAQQATSSVVASAGDTVVFVSVVAGDLNPDLGYFPLSVDY